MPVQLKKFWLPAFTLVEFVLLTHPFCSQQFYAIFIQLYRLFTVYEKDSPTDTVNQQHGFGGMEALRSFSQVVCLTNSINLVDVLVRQQERFGVHPSSIFGIYAAGVAGITLVLSASSTLDIQRKSAAVRRIQSLVDLLHEWCPYYQPAQGITDVLQRLVHET